MLLILLNFVFKALLKTFLNLFASFPQRFRLWIGTTLAIVDSCPDDLEIILNSCLDRSELVHKAAYDYFGNGLLTGRCWKIIIFVFYFEFIIVDNVWKTQRKHINQSFTPKHIDKLVETFSERFYNFAEEVSHWPAENNCDLFPKLFKCNIETAFGKLWLII